MRLVVDLSNFKKISLIQLGSIILCYGIIYTLFSFNVFQGEKMNAVAHAAFYFLIGINIICYSALKYFLNLSFVRAALTGLLCCFLMISFTVSSAISVIVIFLVAPYSTVSRLEKD